MPSASLTRPLGQNGKGPHVSTLGFGAMGLSGAYGPGLSHEEAFKVLDRALELGCTFWDTSDIYGDNEEIIGAWFKKTGNRDKIFLASKFAVSRNADGTIAGIRGDPEYVHEACERSLKRLGIDTIDLYYQHRVDPTVPIEKTVGAMAELVKAGKVRYLGLSECSASTLRRAHRVHPIAAVQMEYSPFSLDIEHETTNFLATARELGVTIIAYSPLGRGLITGQIKSHADLGEKDFRRTVPRFSEENFGKILALVDKFAEVGRKKKATTGQLALAWLLAQGEDIIPIPGTTKVKYLDENWGSLKVDLTTEEIADIRKVVDAADITGDRYGPGLVQTLFADSPPLAE